MAGDALAQFLLIASRLLWYAGIVGIVGACALRVLVRRVPAAEPLSPESSLRALGLTAGAVLVAGTLARLYAQAYVSFGLEEPLTASLLWIVATDLPPWSTGWLAQLAAAVFTVAALALVPWAAKAAWGAASIGAASVAASAPLTGHAVAQAEWPVLPVVLQAGHVLGAGIWIGTLFAMAVTALRRRTPGGHGTAVAGLVEAFSPLALAAAGVLSLTGLATLLIYLTSVSDLWSTVYGRTLSLKLLLFAAVAAAGFVNWRLVRPRLAAGSGAGLLRRSAGLELALAAAVLAVTAVLVGLAQPGEP